MSASGPKVSVIVACRDVGDYIDECLASIRAQSLREIEVIVVDDASTDETRQRVAIHAAADDRVRLLAGEGRGPAAARNLGIAAARGEYLSIVDGDDVVHPLRLEILLGFAEANGLDIAGDELLAFGVEDEGLWAHPFIFPKGCPAGFSAISVEHLLVPPPGTWRELPLGYLKLLIRKSALGDLRYDETLRIGEDFDLFLKLLIKGCKTRFLALAMYAYRRHSASISHRIGTGEIQRMIASNDAMAAMDGLSEHHRRIIRRRGERMRDYSGALDMVDLAKRKALFGMAGLAARRPGALAIFGSFAGSGVAKRVKALLPGGEKQAVDADRGPLMRRHPGVADLIACPNEELSGFSAWAARLLQSGQASADADGHAYLRFFAHWPRQTMEVDRV